jgi:hypothetical protein
MKTTHGALMSPRMARLWAYIKARKIHRGRDRGHRGRRADLREGAPMTRLIRLLRSAQMLARSTEERLESWIMYLESPRATQKERPFE